MPSHQLRDLGIEPDQVDAVVESMLGRREVEAVRMQGSGMHPARGFRAAPSLATCG